MSALLRSVATILALALLTLASLTLASTANAEPIRLKFAFFASDREYAYPGVVKPFVDAVNLEAAGIVDIKVFPGGSLGRTYREQMRLVLDGVADIGWMNPSLTPEQFPDNAVMELPGLFRDVGEATRVYGRLVASHALRGYDDFFVIAALGSRPLGIHMRPPVASLADLAGKRIRSLNDTESAVLKALGMEPQVLPINRTAEAINVGTVDGSTAPPGALVDFGISRFTTYHYLLDLGTAPLMIVMNRKTFESLPRPAQDAIRRYSGEWATSRYVRSTDAYENSVLQTLASEPKRKVIYPTEAELAAAAAAFRTVTGEWAAQDERHHVLLKQVQAELARARAER